MKVFKHSGNIGDIIYSLPAVKQLGGGNFYLFINAPYNYSRGADHPNGNILLNMQSALMLRELLLYQSYINQVIIVDCFQGYKKILNKQIIIDYDLDLFRKLPIMFQAGNIPRWYFYLFNVYCDLSNCWLQLPGLQISNNIIVSRTRRYRNNNINYSFLSEYKVLFVGLQSEYSEFKKYVNNARYYKCKNFYQLAKVIASSKFFIGNQSMHYAIAQRVKAPRILQICPFAPNVIPYGINAYDFYSQQSFEKIVRGMFDKIK